MPCKSHGGQASSVSISHVASDAATFSPRVLPSLQLPLLLQAQRHSCRPPASYQPAKTEILSAAVTVPERQRSTWVSLKLAFKVDGVGGPAHHRSNGADPADEIKTLTVR